jgi:hypothetical protein
MMMAIGDNLRDIASSYNEEDVEVEYDKDTELGKLSSYDEPSLVMVTIPKMVE